MRTRVEGIRVIGPGHFVFAAGLAGLGLLSLLSGDFAYSWQPVPQWVPWREVLARLSGALLLAGGLGMLVKRIAARSAIAMTLFLLSWILLLRTTVVAHSPLNVGVWLGVSENLVLMTGGWVLAARLAGPRDVRAARGLLGFSCLILGLSHFVYADITAGMVPEWLPYRLGWARLTGAGHLAAGLGILSGVVPRLAAALEAIMIASFVLLLHLPGVVSDPGSRMQWTMLFVAAAQAGAFAIYAGSPGLSRDRIMDLSPVRSAG